MVEFLHRTCILGTSLVDGRKGATKDNSYTRRVEEESCTTRMFKVRMRYTLIRVINLTRKTREENSFRI